MQTTLKRSDIVSNQLYDQKYLSLIKSLNTSWISFTISLITKVLSGLGLLWLRGRPEQTRRRRPVIHKHILDHFSVPWIYVKHFRTHHWLRRSISFRICWIWWIKETARLTMATWNLRSWTYHRTIHLQSWPTHRRSIWHCLENIVCHQLCLRIVKRRLRFLLDDLWLMNRSWLRLRWRWHRRKHLKSGIRLK